MINKNKTWLLVERPKDQKIIRVKWVFKTKLNLHGVDYQEIFAPVATYNIIRIIFVFVVFKK